MRLDDAARRRVRRWAFAAIGGLIVAVGAVAITYTPLFGANDIRVDGPASIPRAEVLALADVGAGTNVFHLDAAATERALERDPRILDARLTISLPDGIRIHIEPRVPVGLLGVPAMLVGADGVVIGPAGRSGALPSLRSEGGRAASGRGLVAAAAAAAALGPDLRDDVDAVVVAPDGTLELVLREGFAAYLGEATELEQKATSLAAVLGWAQEQGARVLSADLAVPSSPTARLEGGPTSVPIA